MSVEKQAENDSTSIKIQKCPEPYARVPNHLAQNPNISANAIAVITYLCSRGDKWEPRVSDIRKRFSFCRNIWLKVSKELRVVGVLSDIVTKDGRKLEFHPYGQINSALAHCGLAQNDRTHKEKLSSHGPSGGPSSRGTIYKEQIMNKNIYNDHDPVDNSVIVDKSKKLKQPKNDFYKKIKITHEKQDIIDKLIGWGWKKNQAIGTVINRKYELIDFYTIIDEMRKNKTPIKNKGAYIRASLRNLEEERRLKK